MKARNSIFIVIATILIILFVLSVLENMFIFSTSAPSVPALEEYQNTIVFERAKRVENLDTGLLKKLHELGLAPREAKYYEVTE